MKVHFKKRVQNLLIIKQIEKTDNRKNQNTYDLMIWYMATPCWSWDKILDSVRAGKNGPPQAEAMDGQRNHFEEKD